MKKVSLKQQQIGTDKYQYRVLQVSNSVRPKISDVLSEQEARAYCKDSTWSVTIKGE